MSKIKTVRHHIMMSHGTCVTHADLLNIVLDHWIREAAPISRKPQVSTFESATKKQANQELFLVAKSSINKLVAVTEDHAKYCSSRLMVKKVVRTGHVGQLKLSCRRLGRSKHTLRWNSSPRLPGNQFLVNERVHHGLVFSGMRPSHYQRLVECANIGCINEHSRRNFIRTYDDFIQKEYDDSVEAALVEEIAMYPIPMAEDDGDDEDEEPYEGIDIKTDARHGHRRNAKDTSVVALGERSHKVLQHVHITKEQDTVTQRHEKLGTDKIYQKLEQQNVMIRAHTHDRNMAVNKLVRDSNIVNQNDVWHAVKALKKLVDSISHGAQKRHGSTWHVQLAYKVEPL